MEKTVAWKKFKKELLNNKEVEIEHKKLQPKYKIIEQIIQKRIKMNLTQKQFATKVQTKQSAISRLESGTYNPSLKFLKKIAEAMNSRLVIAFE